MSLRRQKPEPPATTSSRLSNVLAIGLANRAPASVAKVKREKGVTKAMPADIADSLSELMQRLDVDSIEMKRGNSPITLDDSDDPDEPDKSSALTPCTREGCVPKNMRRAAPGMGWNYGRNGIADDSNDARKKKRKQKDMARMLYINYRLVPMPGDSFDSDEDTADLVPEEMNSLVRDYRAAVEGEADADKKFNAMYNYLVNYTHTEVTDAARQNVDRFVDQAYADTTQAAQAPDAKPVVQVVSTESDVAASYMLYLEKASAVAMRIRVEVPGESRRWNMAASSRLPKAEAHQRITDFVTQNGVAKLPEFKADAVKECFRGHLSRKSADTEP